MRERGAGGTFGPPLILWINRSLSEIVAVLLDYFLADLNHSYNDDQNYLEKTRNPVITYL